MWTTNTKVYVCKFQIIPRFNFLISSLILQAFLNNPLGSNIGSHNQKISTSLPPLSPSVLEARLKEELVALGLLEPNEVSLL